MFKLNWTDNKFQFDKVNLAGECLPGLFGHITTHVPVLNADGVFGGITYDSNGSFRTSSTTFIFDGQTETSFCKKAWLHGIQWRVFRHAEFVGKRLFLIGGSSAENVSKQT